MSTPENGDWRHLLTEAERARMLDDIARVSLVVGRRLSPERAWDDLDIAAGSLATRKSPVERLWFVERLLPELARAVHQIAETPMTLPVREARTVAPPVRARRIAASAVLTAVRRGHAERFLEEQSAVVSADTLENRAVKAFLQTLRRDMAAIGGIAAAAGEAEIAETARAVSGRLRGLRTLPLWEAVSDDAGAWRVPPTHRMLADARYARLAEAMRRYRQSFQFDWSNPLFALPSRETWRLYEAWGLFQVLEALLALGYAPEADTGAAAHALFAVHQERLTFALVKGTESRVGLSAPDGRRLALFYNRSYPQRVRSLSRTMQPDVAIESLPTSLLRGVLPQREDEGNCHQPPQVVPDPPAAGGPCERGTSEQGGGAPTWILDPKFKSYAVPGAEGDDMDQMHAYRDAIVDARGQKSITRAWCLFTGAADDSSRPMIAYGPPAASIVGALRLRPGDTGSFERLCQLLSSWELQCVTQL